MSQISDRISYLAHRGGWLAVAKLPEKSAYALFQRLADTEYRRQGKGVRQLARNLARVIGEPADSPRVQELTAAGMRSYLRYWCDAFRLPTWDAARLGEFEFHDVERLTDLLQEGRGVVAVLPHMGNWDHAAAYMSQLVPGGQQVTTVAEKLRPPELFEKFVSYREELGIRVFGLGDPGVFQQLGDIVTGGGLVALLGDRDLSAKGIDVDLFGSRTRIPAGAAALAHDAGAPLLPVGLFWDGQRNAGRIYPEIPLATEGGRRERLAATCQRIATAFEEAIVAHPQDWHMLQKLWLEDLDQDRLRAADSAATLAGDPAAGEAGRR
ncbi:MAG: phosphatidylinositol mannoside acyltransferase [Candidatus Nanopelagicales bacterium]